MKKLYRSRTNRWLAGVCGGLGEFFGIDPFLIRAVFLASVLCGGLGAVTYIVLWIFVPNAAVTKSVSGSQQGTALNGLTG